MDDRAKKPHIGVGLLVEKPNMTVDDFRWIAEQSKGRYSCYIDADMMMVPCSFDQQKRYAVSLKEMTIIEAWNSEPFERFRNKMRGVCPDCEKKALCMGGCPLIPEIVFCNSTQRYIKE